MSNVFFCLLNFYKGCNYYLCCECLFDNDDDEDNKYVEFFKPPDNSTQDMNNTRNSLNSNREGVGGNGNSIGSTRDSIGSTRDSIGSHKSNTFYTPIK